MLLMDQNQTGPGWCDVQAGWLTVLDSPFGDGWNVRLAPPGQINHMREGREDIGLLEGGKVDLQRRITGKEGGTWDTWYGTPTGGGGVGRDGTDVNMIVL